MQKLLVLPVLPYLNLPFVRGSDEALELLAEEDIGDAILRLDEAPEVVDQGPVQIVES